MRDRITGFNARRADTGGSLAVSNYQPVMEAWDKINRRYGKGRLKLASELLANNWEMNRDRLSQCYTTRFTDLPIV